MNYENIPEFPQLRYRDQRDQVNFFYLTRNNHKHNLKLHEIAFSIAKCTKPMETPSVFPYFNLQELTTKK